MPDALIASAFVRIAPEPNSLASFGTTVAAAIKKQVDAKPIPVAVRAQLLPFKRLLQTELDTGKFKIPVTAVLAPGSKAALQTELKALAGLVVPVTGMVTGVTPAKGAAGKIAKSPYVLSIAGQPVEQLTEKGPVIIPPGGTPIEEKAGGTAAKTPQTVFTQNRKKATDALALAQEKLNATTEKGIALDEASRRATIALTSSENALTAAQKNQIAMGDTATKRQTTRLQKDVQAAEQLRAQVLTRKADIQAQKDLAKAPPTTGTAALTKEEKQLQAVQRARLATMDRIVAADQAGALMTTKVAKARAVLRVSTANLAAAEDVRAAAVKTGVQSEIALSEALVVRATTDKAAAKSAFDEAVANKAAASAATQRAAKEALLGRGVLATMLQQLGARGATLAASAEFLAGAAIAVGIGKSVQAAARLETELNVFRIAAKASGDEMIRVSNKAKQLGADITLPAVSANDAAEAMTELAKAGLSVQDSMDAARGTLQLATAAQLDNSEAVNITASALNSFGLAGTQAIHVADLLTGASNEAQGGIGEMGASLGQVGAVSRQFGVSIEDTIALLTLLAKNGIQGAEGGTALKMAFLRLAAPTNAARKLLKEFNIQVLDTQGALRPEVFGELQAAVDKLSPSVRNAALSTIFGARAIRAQGVLGREGAVGLNAMREATNQQGLAAQLAGARTAGFTGKVESLKNSAATTGLSIGQLLIPPLDILLQSLNADITAVGKLIEELRKLAGMKIDFGLPGDKAIENAFNPREFGRFMDRITAGIPVVNAFFDPIGSRSEESKRALKDLGAAIDATRGKTIQLALDLDKSVKAKGISGAVQDIRNLEKKIKIAKPANADQLLSFLQSVERSLTALGKAPNAIQLQVLFERGFVPTALKDMQDVLDAAPPLKVKAGFASDSVLFPKSTLKRQADIAAATTAQQFSVVFGNTLPPQLAAVVNPTLVADAIHPEEAGKQAGARLAIAAANTFSTRFAVLVAEGASNATLLAEAERGLAAAEKHFQAVRAHPGRYAPGHLKEAADLVTARRGEVQRIKDQIDSDARQAASDLQTARDKADQAILDAISGRQGRISNLILRAEGTPRLSDDIKRHTQMRDELKRDIREAQGLKDAKLRAQTIQTLTADLIRENQTISDLNKQLVASISERFQVRISIATVTGTVSRLRALYAAWIKALTQALKDVKKGSKAYLDILNEINQTRQAAYQAINESFELDISFAQTKNNTSAEIAARERYIAQLKREQAQYKKGTLEWKRYRNLIAEQNAAIAEATGVMKKNVTAQQQFSFLQMQAGFVGNLLGNLIPMGATTGLVGGSAGSPLGIPSPTTGTGPFGHPPPIKGPLSTEPFGHPPPIKGKLPTASVTKAGATVPGTPTKTGQAYQNHILEQILRVLQNIYRGTGHPEANTHRNRARNDMELSAHH